MPQPQIWQDIRPAVTSAATATGGGTDKRALIVLYLGGGLDHNSFLTPAVAGANRTAYEAARPNTKEAIDANVRLTNTNWQLHRSFFSATPANNAMAVFTAGQGAILLNTGPLSRVTNKSNVGNGGTLPYQLYSHSDQSKIWQTALPLEPAGATGFLGRLVEMLSPSFNTTVGGVTYPAMFTFSGKGEFSQTYDLSVAGLASTGLASRGTGPAGSTLKSQFDALIFPTDTSALNPMQKFFVQSNGTSEVVTTKVAEVLALPAATISVPATIDASLKTALQMCKVMGSLGQRRQIHYLSQGGFDQHSALVADVNTRLSTTRNYIKQFYDAINDSSFISTGVKVTLMVYSEFGRTLTENGDGTDHAWGGHAMLFGADVRGTNGTAVASSCLYGTEHTLDFQNSAVNSQYVSGFATGGVDLRGLMIPTTPIDCLYSTVSKWMGVPDTLLSGSGSTANPMDLVLPNLVNFPTNSGPTARDLGMLA
jgi:uncharacterized protein (DUF1501 family)